MRFLKFICITVLLIACNNNSIKKPKKPDDLISKDKMVEVLYDLSIVTSAKQINKNLLEKEGVTPKRYVFEKHDIDSLQFALSNDYYAYDVDLYEGIYKQLNNKLKSEKEQTQKIVDSLNKLNEKEGVELEDLDLIKSIDDDEDSEDINY